MSTVLIVDDSKTSRYMLRHILVEMAMKWLMKRRMDRKDMKSIVS